ncbi:hypothetical protein [Virgibacillus pantothenticus]|uniref:hypothetical protein n=1 Tax=Virgibacillus pantothenticus TaxID=1473 RepID=UPI0009565ACB|nr:hypothetical protein [Virgibacillus pantothenticus]GIP62834.1 hypothetical protein J32TS6_13890 [Virgibacillus pantothenticus]SIT13874.1 hypothetical protein SAMN05421787_1211 [Virgibacillus pantothenticus]
MSKRRSKHTLDERIEAVLRVIEGMASVTVRLLKNTLLTVLRLTYGCVNTKQMGWMV